MHDGEKGCRQDRTGYVHKEERVRVRDDGKTPGVTHDEESVRLHNEEKGSRDSHLFESHDEGLRDEQKRSRDVHLRGGEKTSPYVHLDDEGPSRREAGVA